ncbi:MAG: RpiB/LacA/LacB family sugar-phosphate isomerase [Candidatus Sungbacteria bacterium]|nr:RpiB/LacA/LacB family sugar-phosphate isomerase [Candidatus Sungbacteria bacterium]
MTIYLAADHRGLQLKEGLKEYLIDKGYAMEDVGAFSYDKDDDYVDFARIASEKIVNEPDEHRGIFVCGSGYGMDIVANKHRGLFAARCGDIECAVQSREHGNSNVLTLGADTVDVDAAKKIVEIWLKTPFSGEERHMRRLEKIREIEEKNFK